MSRSPRRADARPGPALRFGAAVAVLLLCSVTVAAQDGWSFTLFTLSNRLFLSVEAQLIAARARFPVAGGHATAPNVALHVLAGLGYRF